MLGPINIVERAFQLARSGLYPTVADVRRILLREGFTHYEIANWGPLLSKQIHLACQKADRAHSGATPRERSQSAEA